MKCLRQKLHDCVLNTKIVTGGKMEDSLNTAKYQSLIDLTIFWIKSLLTLNGGAIITLLAFSGNIVSKKLEYPRGLNCVFKIYIWGLIFSLLQLSVVYLLELFKFEQRKSCFIILFFYLAIFFAITSSMIFCLGSYQAINVFDTLATS